ncbi:fatty-acyl-CoA synthase [Sphingomonas sp. UYAg733]
MTDQIATLADIERIERRPLAERMPFHSTYGLLLKSAAEFGANPAIIHLPNASVDDAVVRIDHNCLFARVTQTANLFTTLGIGKDDVVSYMLPSLPQTHYTLWGAQAAGIANPLNPLLSVDHLAALMSALNTKLLVVPGPEGDPGLWLKVQALVDRVPSLRDLVVVGSARPNIVEAIPFDLAIAQQPGDRLISGRVIEPDDVAAAFHTGGTTGEPKLALHTHLNEAHAAWAGGLLAGYRSDDIMLNGMPLFHVGGTIICSLSVFAFGGAVAILTPTGMRNPEVAPNYWKIVEALRATVVGGVPTAIATIAAVDAEGCDLSSLRSATSGAAGLPGGVADAFRRTSGLPVREMLGMTETGGVLSVSPRHGVHRPGSSGLRLPYEQVVTRRASADGSLTTDCEPGDVGTLLVKGPNVFPGYHNPALNSAAFTSDGWFITGDLARIDPEGHLHVVGRSKDVIIRSGHNIDPALIENAALQHPAIRLAAAVGQPDRYAGEVPALFVVTSPDGGLAPDAIREFLAERVSERPALPRNVFILDALPVTAIGKIFKPELRRIAAQSTLEAELAQYLDDGMIDALDVALDESGRLAVVVTVAPRCPTAIEQSIAGVLSAHLFESRIERGQ